MTELTKYRIIGLTGMSGAGKSTVGKVFSQSGFFWIDCDKCAREVAAEQPFLAELAERFSPEVINSDGTLDRRKTAELIFSSEDKRLLYNKIIYPYIAYNILDKIKTVGCDILLDAPTLFEARLDPVCTAVVSVLADKELCCERIIKRDGISREQAKARLSSQHTAEFFRERSDYCIENNGTVDELIQAAENAARQLKGN